AAVRTVWVRHLDGVWVERGLPVRIRGAVMATDGAIAVSGVSVAAGRSTASVPIAGYQPKTGAVSATWGGVVSGVDVAAVAPTAPPLPDTQLQGGVERRGKEQPIVARASGTAGAHGDLRAAFVVRGRTLADLEGTARVAFSGVAAGVR